jgi:hypothetical protein
MSERNHTPFAVVEIDHFQRHTLNEVVFNTYSCSMSSFCVTEPYYIDTVPYIAKIHFRLRYKYFECTRDRI